MQTVAPIRNGQNGEIREFVTDANTDALNAAVKVHGVTQHQILAVHLLPGTPLAHGARDKYRVLYWG